MKPPPQTIRCSDCRKRSPTDACYMGLRRPYCYDCGSIRHLRAMQRGEPVALALYRAEHVDPGQIEWSLTDWPSERCKFSCKVRMVTIAGGKFVRRKSVWIANTQHITYERLSYSYAAVRFKFGGFWWHGRRSMDRRLFGAGGANGQWPVAIITFRRTKKPASGSDVISIPEIK